MSYTPPTLSIIIPFYNEADNIETLFARLCTVLEQCGESYEIVCIDDGSRDDTLARLLEKRQEIPGVRIFELARNFGKEAAMTVGLDHMRGLAAIPLDSDLQDPPELIPEMVTRWRQGYEVVLAQRTDRQSDTLPKRMTAAAFYRLHNRISEVRIPQNVGDFRLMDRVVVEAIRPLREQERFMKGIFSWPGFKQTTISYAREARHQGATKWNYWKLWNFAIDGITSFSTAPLRFWTYLGVVVSLSAFVYALIVIIKTLIFGVDTPGYASLVVIMLFLGGLQFISLGIIGEYVGRIHSEVKGRPIYVLRSVHEDAGAEEVTVSESAFHGGAKEQDGGRLA
ncbi:MAG: glycosyltransferase family 2 protein [Magnetococcales bacterium]|nr:glycosyltransferase family 2 protein [Magnetococcales bacterium]